MLAFVLWVASLLSVPPVVNGEDLLLPVFGVSFAEPPYFEVRQRRPFAAAATTTIFSGLGSTDSTSTTALSTTSTSLGSNATTGSGSTTESEQTPPGFPLQSTTVDAKVTNGVAHVTVKQAYMNTAEECLDTRYVVPLPPMATISAMVMTIGDRVVVAEIRAKEEARQEFEDAQDSGQSAALLEQEQQGVFTMELANILPGDVVEVIVEYVETLVPIDGVFAFTFPSVVGPSYAEDWDSAIVAEVSNLTVDVMLEVMPTCLGVDSDLPLQLVSDSQTSTQAVVSGAGADIIMKFWFTEQDISVQLLLDLEQGTPSDGSGYFSLAVLSPQRRLLQPSEIVQREYMFILDSHFGFEAANGTEDAHAMGVHLGRNLMLEMLRGHLRPGDSFNIMILDKNNKGKPTHSTLVDGPSIAVNEANVAMAEEFLNNSYVATSAPSRVELLSDGLSWAWGPYDYSSRSRNLVLMTSGHSKIRDYDWEAGFDGHLDHSNLVVIGLLPSMNFPLIKAIAAASYGAPFLARTEAEGRQTLQKLQSLLDTPVLTDVRLIMSHLHIESRMFDLEPPRTPDVLSSRPLQVVGKWSGDVGQGELKVQGYDAHGSYWQRVIDLSQIHPDGLPVLRLQWARSRIALSSSLASVGVDTREEVTQLGLEHSLVTAFTSFVAVDSHAVAPDVCGSASTTITSTVVATTTDRYGFGSDDDDDSTFIGTNTEAVSGCPVAGPSSFSLRWLMLWLLYEAAS